MIMTVELYGGLKTNTGMFVGLGHWITAQAVKRSLLKAQIRGVQVPVHYQGLQYRGLVQ